MLDLTISVAPVNEKADSWLELFLLLWMGQVAWYQCKHLDTLLHLLLHHSLL